MPTPLFGLTRFIPLLIVYGMVTALNGLFLAVPIGLPFEFIRTGLIASSAAPVRVLVATAVLTAYVAAHTLGRYLDFQGGKDVGICTAVLRPDKRYCRTLGIGSSSAPDTVHVVFGLAWEIEVDH